MSNITLGGDLAHVYFEIAEAVDRGAEASVDEAHMAVLEGYVVELLERYHEIDLSALDEDERDGINTAYQQHAPEPEKLGFQNNGLAYLAGAIISIIRFGEWEEGGEGPGTDMDKLELKL